MACHTLMAFILYCAAKQMQIESRTCQACLGNYAEISCQREQSKTCLSYAECSRYSTKLNAALLMQSYKFSPKQMSKCLDNFLFTTNLTFYRVFRYIFATISQKTRCKVSTRLPHPSNLVCRCPTLVCKRHVFYLQTPNNS